MSKRILALLLAMLMLVFVVACGKKTDGKETDDSQTTDDTEDNALQSYMATYAPEDTAETYVDTEVLNKDYGGYEFTFLNSDDIYFMYVYLDPEMTGDTLDDCCYERNFMAEQYFNITINEETQPYNQLASYAKTLILSGEDVYDAMYIGASSLTPLISENLFVDLLEVEELYIDKVWWDQPLIQRNIIEDRLFYATSDLHLMAFEGVWVMYFNEDMMVDIGLDLPFELALDGKWTFDKMKEYLSAAANLNGDTNFKLNVDGNSRYGVVTVLNNGICMTYGMGTEYVARDENGRYQFTADTDPKFTDTIEKLIGLWGPDNGLALKANNNADLDPDGYYGLFMDNRALFLYAELKGATMLREWEGSFGLMPQPKYDENQEHYNHNVFSNCLSFCIPNTNKNLERTGVIVDYLTYMSYQSLLPRYYDIHVALKALERQESIDVLAHIRSTRGIEVSVPYGWTNDLYVALSNLLTSNTNAIASSIETYREQCVTNINNTYNEYPTLNSVKK